MKRLLLTTLVGLVAAAVASPAQADGPGYTGSCHFSVVSDTTPGGTLGGPDVWTGRVDIAVVANDPRDRIDAASCWLHVNGDPPTKILDATVAGPVGAGAGLVTFRAGLTDVVYVCRHVEVSGRPAHDSCFDNGPTPICPGIVCDSSLLDDVVALSQAADPVVCPHLVAVAPAVNDLPTNTVLYVDPATGDTYVGGTTADALFWDCPPYV